MTPEIERLLGGYATNTLTEQERKLLYEAALEDQNLFNALEDEQALRELLSDEECRREIVRALRPAPAKPSRTWVWAFAGSVAAGLVLLVVLLPRNAHRRAMTVALSTPHGSFEIASPAPPAAPAPVKTAPRKKAKAAAPTEPIEVAADAAAPARGSLTVGGIAPAPAQPLPGVSGFRAMTPTAALSKAVSPAPFDIIPSGDAIQLKLRPLLPGSLAVSERLADGAWKALPADDPIPVDREKVIRVEWLNAPGSAPHVTLLRLSPGKPAVIITP